MDQKGALRLARDYVNYIDSQHYYKVREAFLFGSYARNHFTEDSDIDIAIVFEDYKDSLEELANLMRLRRNFDLRIEPHPISTKDFKINDSFNKHIKKGLKIFKRN